MYAYFQPCITDSVAKELDTATKLVAKKLNIELVNAPFSCCGRGMVEDGNLDTQALINIRNIAVAKKQGAGLVTTSSTCYNALKKAQKIYEVDKSIAQRMDKKLAQVGLKYDPTTEVKHLIEVLHERKKSIHLKAAGRLGNLRVAPYYGKKFLNPKTYMPQKKSLFEHVLQSCGAKIINFTHKEAACGAQTMLTNEKTSVALTADIINAAQQQGADVLVTLCPFEHMMCDMYQKKANKNANIPVLHFAQLVALAIGIHQDELNLERHFIATAPLFDKIRQ